MSMKEEEMIEKLRKEVEIPDKVRQKANEAFASIKKGRGGRSGRGKSSRKKNRGKNAGEKALDSGSGSHSCLRYGYRGRGSLYEVERKPFRRNGCEGGAEA